MQNLEPNIRNAVRAVIIRDSSILLIRKEYEDDSQRFALPGGAQDPHETLTTALNRECKEEIGTEVSIESLLHVADWFKPRDTTPPSTRHLVEFLFTCHVADSYAPHNGHHPDKHQVEVTWIELDTLQSLPFHPRSLLSLLAGKRKENPETYLGKIN